MRPRRSVRLEGRAGNHRLSHRRNMRGMLDGRSCGARKPGAPVRSRSAGSKRVCARGRRSAPSKSERGRELWARSLSLSAAWLPLPRATAPRAKGRDRYAQHVAPADLGDLYRCASLVAAGIPVAGSSDAPYASADPWQSIAAAIDRRGASGTPLGVSEALTPRAALDLYLGKAASPGKTAKPLAAGDAADLCLLNAPLGQSLAEPDRRRVRGTWLDGSLTHAAL